jgi:hypothetical protein
LRYILEAPKLKISKDEMVSIPIIDKDYDRWVIAHHCLLDVSDCGGTTCWTASVTWSCFIHLIFLCGTTTGLFSVYLTTAKVVATLCPTLVGHLHESTFELNLLVLQKSQVLESDSSRP